MKDESRCWSCGRPGEPLFLFFEGTVILYECSHCEVRWRTAK